MLADASDMERLSGWIGRTEEASDVITPELAKRLAATLGRALPDAAEGAPAPLAVHWCLALPAVPAAGLGEDGHPKLGGFLPPVPLPRRMWAGGALTFADRLRIGDEVRRVSRIADVTVKHGRSGALCFVAVDHEIFTERGLALTERHDIVYRPVATPGDTQVLPQREEPGAERRIVAADPVLLFRYSALTFNGHRIHYDRPYCLEHEGYPGLVFHGPLQATLLIQFAQDLRPDRPLRRFTFRSTAPIFDGGEISLNARPEGDGVVLWTADQEDRPAMRAEASW